MKLYIYKYNKSLPSETYARDALSRFTGKGGEAFEFKRGKHGKPYEIRNEVFFSLSHSGEILICAVSKNEVGADVEKIRSVEHMKKIAQRYFENEKISDEKDFFNAWVKREAYLKYKGTGFANGGKEKAVNVFLKNIFEIDGYAVSVCAKDEEFVEIVKLFS
jgi:4'-phosphopantetheinyl transferase